MKQVAVLLAAASLTGCATHGAPSGALSSYDGLQKQEGSMRTGVSQRIDQTRLRGVRSVSLPPAVLADTPSTRWLSAEERRNLLAEIDAQICFELSERYEITAHGGAADAHVRAVVTRVSPTGRAASALSAASGFLIPGPVGLRVPGTIGGLGAEAEMILADGVQASALIWNRNATPIGTDKPSMSRIGDAMQFAEPFGDAVASTMAKDKPRIKNTQGDPCARHGPRLRAANWLAGAATGLYVPPGARKAGDEDKRGAKQ
ncbi:DUF3313 domain-containing protein [Caulobacter flavus]|uniref:DUF3313 domain-containing protein n=1 Tax=Caulobacter flavus TaxID=1679497 RepID=A0A2N5CWX6_9CAUL|nr:DUF3313 family protein [Caulobacter flavus]AYV47476.1 DUF3313 domain-containing protein [Caulobacter flavus]PLR18317.1 DUF3313 domain-containing protein [Caulobacter flavus]